MRAAIAWGVSAGLMICGTANAQELSTQDTRLTMGLEQSGSASSPLSQTVMVDAMLTAPLTQAKMAAGRTTFPRAIAWANFRFTGLPQQGTSSIAEFAGGFSDSVAKTATGKAVQALAMMFGLEVKIVDGAEFRSDGTHRFVFEPTVVFGVGGITPIQPSESAAVFQLSDEARSRFGVPKDDKLKYIAFVQPDRNRFFRQWFAGLRFKTHHFGHAADGLKATTEANFPGLIDLTIGKSEAVSGGTLDSLVGRIEGFYPLPVENLARTIYVFGAAYMHLSKGAEITPVILAAPDASVKIPGPDVFIHTLTPEERNRDFWKIGVGVDLVALFRSVKAKE